MARSFNLLEHFPDRWRSLLEVQAICDSDLIPVGDDDRHTIPHLWKCMDDELNNSFIIPYGTKDGADEYTCSRWEKMLGIDPANAMSLSDRQFKIYTQLYQSTPYTYTALQKMLDELVGVDNYEIVSDKTTSGLSDYTHDELSEYTHNDLRIDNGRNANKELTVKLSLESRFKADAVEDLLDRIVPADMILNTTVAYTTHNEMSVHTHNELSTYTHTEIKVTEM